MIKMSFFCLSIGPSFHSFGVFFPGFLHFAVVDDDVVIVLVVGLSRFTSYFLYFVLFFVVAIPGMVEF